MLTSLRIENFAIVKQLELDFSAGMTAFTGETGAGKSIMIDALMLALGGRADISVIRAGEQKCDISAVFCTEPNGEPAEWLLAHDVVSEEEGIILRRILTAEGRSKSYINGQPFPLHKVKELSEMLVHIHGQHQHQTLLNHATHRNQLDNFSAHTSLQNNVETLYKKCQSVKHRLDDLISQDNHRDRMALLTFQIDELSALHLQDGEMQILSDEHQLLHHAKDYLQRTEQIANLLNADEGPSVFHSLHQILQILQQLPAENIPIKNARELINNAIIHCEETENEMRSFSEQVSLNPERLQEVENRMSILHQAARKHHVEASVLPLHAKSLQEELAELHDIDRLILTLQEEYQTLLSAYEKAAAELGASRQYHAEKLSQEINTIIRQLGMPNGRISIMISPLAKMQAHGMDKVEYLVTTNPGLPEDTLCKVVSGGELSRISLAIQMITAQKGATPTLLFDEVDVGIGGATAALVGKLLRKLGERLQVFCVTHQPQVASSAHHHFVVEKTSDKEHTYTEIVSLNEVDKINEIARMLGGLTITEQTRSHARELLIQSH